VRTKKEKVTAKRNYAIEIWRFFFAVAITGYHIGFILPMSMSTGANGYFLAASNWMRGAGEILFVFTLTSGYFLVKHFKRLDAESSYGKKSASSRAWEYIWGRIKALIPVLALGIFLGIIIMSAYYDITAWDAIKGFMNGIWEFFGFYSAGFSPSSSFGQPNAALWFISSLLIVSYFVYWILCKNEDLFKGFIAPFLFIFLGGWWSHTGTRASQTGWSTLGLQSLANNATSGSAASGTAVIGFNNGLLFVLIGICAGVLIYYLVDFVKKIKFDEFSRTIFTLLYLVVAVLLVWYTVYPATVFEFNRWAVHLLCILLVTLTMIGEDWISKLLNNEKTAPIFNYLGGSALYLYMVHLPIAYLVVMLLGKNNLVTAYSWSQVFWPTIIISLVLSIFLKYVMDKYVIKRK